MDLELVRAFIRSVQNGVTHTPFMNYGFQVKLVEGQTYKTIDTMMQRTWKDIDAKN